MGLKMAEKIRTIAYYENWSHSTSGIKVSDSLQITYTGRTLEEENPQIDSGMAEITQEQFDALCNLVEQNGFFSLDDNYSASIDEWPHYSITVQTPSISKTVNCKAWLHPQFEAIQKKILELWGKPILREAKD
ncbi:MAG: hypothetical protein V1835_04485 [Candidatus Micrarchaeota archaeon]